MKPYQFVLLRYVHNAASDEFVNVGLLMWLPQEKELLHKISSRYGRISAFFQDIDVSSYRLMIKGIKKTVEGLSNDINKKTLLKTLPEMPKNISEVLSCILHRDASCLQWSEIMGGFIERPEERLEKLFSEMIEKYEAKSNRRRHDEGEILDFLEKKIETRGLTNCIEKEVIINSDLYSYKFKFGWQNGVKQVLEPISLDYLNPIDVVEKANVWTGRLLNLSKSVEFKMTGVVAPPQKPELIDSYLRAVDILSNSKQIRAIITEDQFENTFIDEIKKDLNRV